MHNFYTDSEIVGVHNRLPIFELPCLQGYWRLHDKAKTRCIGGYDYVHKKAKLTTRITIEKIINFYATFQNQQHCQLV